MSAATTPRGAPEIITERLTLTRPHLTDFDDSFALWSDELVVKHIGGRAFTREECWGRFLRYIGHWEALGFGYWIVREKAGDRFVGEVGFADFQRNIEPSMEGMKEAGWVLTPRAHGKGFATEAVLAAHAWNEDKGDHGRTACIIDTENAASIRVAEKCGYREWTRTTYKGTPIVMFDRTPAG